MYQIVLILFFSFCKNAVGVPQKGVQLFPGQFLSPYHVSRWPSTKGNFLIANATGIYVNTFSLWMVLKCQAKFPIQWNITGHFNFGVKTNIPLYKRIRNAGGNFTYVLHFIREHSLYHTLRAVEQDKYASATFICQSVEYPDVMDYVDVFYEGKQLFTSTYKRTKPLRNTNIIPCETTNPSRAVNLFKYNDVVGEAELISSTEYIFNPRIGFDLLSEVEGNYTCKSLNDTVSMSATLESGRVNGFYYQPVEKRIYSLWTENITITCGTTGNAVKDTNITIRQSKVLKHDVDLGSISVTIQHNSTQRVSWIITGLDFRAVDNTYSIFCETHGDLIWRWDIKFLVVPHLYLDNFNREVVCTQNFEYNMSVRSTECNNPVECQWMTNCLASGEVSGCSHEFQKEHSNATLPCRSQNGVEAYRFCTVVPFTHQNGIFQCDVIDKDGAVGTKQWSFYVTLENIKKEISEHVETHELIQMDGVLPVQYTNVTSTFFCKAVAFWFASPLMFKIEFLNGTDKWVESTFRVQVNKDWHPRAVKGVNIVAELNIQLPLEAVALICHASWYNSSEFITARQQFKTLHQFEPKSQVSVNNSQLTLKDKGQKFNCSVLAEPAAKYKWFRNMKPIVGGTDFEITQGEHGESLLEFKSINKSLIGEWVCTAENKFGTIRIPFFIDDVVFQSSDTKFVWIFSTLLVIVMIILLVIVYIKYLRRKKYEDRNLTDKEVLEFFEGNPELLSPKGNDPQNLDFLPYNKNYEIDSTDLEFEYVKILGAGAFATVVQGRRPSVNKNVAVKITKSSGDVETFKSLLLEIKIMIYLGKHDHLVRFLGACTTNIQMRQIHIVTEICERGSLQNVLRKGKSSFRNLMDNIQDVDVLHDISDGIESENKFISTMDLIRWSGEIAHGMEYLVHKSVIHADLATRNVLINSEFTAKISDFGLSRKLYESSCYTKRTKCKLPFRWMSVESLQNLTFSAQSDVWSFGMTIWEIFTLGNTPFANETWNKEFVNRLLQGIRPEKPKYANLEIYFQMMACWDETPELRPEFSTLRKHFKSLFEKFSNNCKGIPLQSNTTESEMLETTRESKSDVQKELPEYANFAFLDSQHSQQSNC